MITSFAPSVSELTIFHSLTPRPRRSIRYKKKGTELLGAGLSFSDFVRNVSSNKKSLKKQENEKWRANLVATPRSNDTQRQVLEALAKSPEACGSKELTAATGLEAKQISCQITALKNKGYVSSPARCKYEITEQGKDILG